MIQPLLSICIPTYNRADILKGSLECVTKQLKDICLSELEIYVSDNCSSDNTREVVESFIQQGFPITYNRNKENLLAAGNFLHCMNWASGKYIYLLGDDDYLLPGTISLLLNTLRGKEFGLLYIECEGNGNTNLVKEYSDKTEFVKRVSYYYTFMSGCIFRKSVVKEIEDPIRYKPSHLLQMPFYLQSTLRFDCNAVLSGKVLQAGAASNSNGGYNFFDVFIHWYMDIMEEYLGGNKNVDCEIVAFLKKDIWPFVWDYTKRLLIRKDVGNFKTEKGWSILFKYYGKEWYFWRTLCEYSFGVIKRKIKRLIR